MPYRHQKPCDTNRAESVLEARRLSLNFTGSGQEYSHVKGEIQLAIVGNEEGDVLASFAGGSVIWPFRPDLSASTQK